MRFVSCIWRFTNFINFSYLIISIDFASVPIISNFQFFFFFCWNDYIKRLYLLAYSTIPTIGYYFHYLPRDRHLYRSEKNSPISKDSSLFPLSKFSITISIKTLNYYLKSLSFRPNLTLPSLLQFALRTQLSPIPWNFRFLSIQLAITLRQERTKGRKREANVAKRKIARLLRNKGGYVAFSRYLTSRIRFTYRPDTDDPTATPDTTAYGMQRALLERCRFVEVERGISSLPRSRSDHDSARTRTRGRRLEEESRIMPTLLPATAPFANPWIFERMPILVDRAHICLFDRFWSGWIDGSI